MGLVIVGNKMRSLKYSIICASVFLACQANAFFTGDITVEKEDIVKVYDGDTFYIDLKGTHEVFGKDLGVRITGIDTPEVRSSCATEEEKEKERALGNNARVILEKLLLEANSIVIKNPQRDKYFRINGEIWVDGASVKDILISIGIAVEYDGNSPKPNWCLGMSIPSQEEVDSPVVTE